MTDTRTLETLLTVTQTADALGVSRWTIYRLVRAGDLQSVRVGERIRFRPSELLGYIERNSA